MTQKAQCEYTGLNDAEVEASRAKHGVNALPPPQRTSAWKLFFEKFKDPIICILLAAAYLTSGQAGKAVAVLGLLAFFVACAGAWYGVLGRREEDSYRLFPDLGIGINGLLLVGFVMIYIMGW